MGEGRKSMGAGRMSIECRWTVDGWFIGGSWVVHGWSITNANVQGPAFAKATAGRPMTKEMPGTKFQIGKGDLLAADGADVRRDAIQGFCTGSLYRVRVAESKLGLAIDASS